MKKGYLMVLGAGVSWGCTGLFSTVLFAEGIDPLLVAAVRIFSAALFFALYMLFYYGSLGYLLLESKEWARFLVYGLVGVALFNIFYLSSINYIGVSTAVVLLYTAPAFVVVLSFFILREAITLPKVISLLMAISGTFLVVRAYEASYFHLNLPGVLLGIGSGLTFGLLNVFSKVALRKYNYLQAVFYMFLSGAVFLAMVRPPWLIFNHPLTFTSWLALGGLVFVSTVLAYLLFVSGLNYLESGKASIVAAVEPVAAITMAALFLGERLFVPQYAGVFLVIGGIAVLNIKMRRP